MIDWQRPHRETRYEALRRDDEVQPGWAVFSLQRALNQVRGKAEGDPGFLAEDGAFGQATEQIVKNYQRNRGLTPDGIVGPATQRRVLTGFVATEATEDALPPGLLDGLFTGEGGWNLSAVNWSVSGGVDCGAVQRRVYTVGWTGVWPDRDALFDTLVLKRAFDSRYQTRLLAGTLADRFSAYLPRAGVQTTRYVPLGHIPTAAERAWRLATLAHNYPYAAEKMSRGEVLSSYWSTPALWVPNVRFEDGMPVETPYEWCQFYALGSPAHHHAGVMVELVKSFS